MVALVAPVAAVETQPIWESALVAIVAGAGVTACFAVGVLAAIRYAELRRQERGMLSALAGVVAVIALAAAAGGVVYGLAQVA